MNPSYSDISSTCISCSVWALMIFFGVLWWYVSKLLKYQFLTVIWGTDMINYNGVCWDKCRHLHTHVTNVTIILCESLFIISYDRKRTCDLIFCWVNYQVSVFLIALPEYCCNDGSISCWTKCLLGHLARQKLIACWTRRVPIVCPKKAGVECWRNGEVSVKHDTSSPLISRVDLRSDSKVRRYSTHNHALWSIDVNEMEKNISLSTINSFKVQWLNCFFTSWVCIYL